MKYSEFKRWLEKQGAKFTSGNGAKEIPNPLVNAIKKDLGLK